MFPPSRGWRVLREPYADTTAAVPRWEALSPHYVFTVKVLDHFKHEVNEVLGGVPDEQGVRRKARVALLAGSDLLQTMSAPGVWSTEDLERILDDGGMYVVERAGADVQEAKANMGKWADGISIIPQNIPIDLSSTKVRLFRQKGLTPSQVCPVAPWLTHNCRDERQVLAAQLCKSPCPSTGVLRLVADWGE